jgi:hypothetical protein
MSDDQSNMGPQQESTDFLRKQGFCQKDVTNVIFVMDGNKDIRFETQVKLLKHSN